MSPPNGNIAPPGYYMLFLLDSAGVPSKAQFIQLSLHTGQPPSGTIASPATDLTIPTGGSVNFSTSDSAAKYSWVFPGGSPWTSVAQAPGIVTFSTPGTYTTSLTESDAEGNSDPSPPTRTITVLPATADFHIAVSPPAQEVNPGESTTFTVTVSPLSGFAGSVSLSVDSESGFQTGISSGGFSPASIIGSGTSMLTMNTTSGTKPWALSLTITGTSGTLTHTASTTLLVNLAPPTGLGATPGSGQVSLSWAASVGASSYHVKRATESGGPYVTVGCPTATTLRRHGPQQRHHVLLRGLGSLQRQPQLGRGERRLERGERDAAGIPARSTDGPHGDPRQRPGRPHLDGFGRRDQLQGQARHRQQRALRRGREPCLQQLHEHRADQRHHLLLRRLGGERRRGKPQLRAGERGAAGTARDTDGRRGDPRQRPGRPQLGGFGRCHQLQRQARHRQRRALHRGREPCLHQLHEHRADQRHHLLLRRLGGERRRGKRQLRAGERDAAATARRTDGPHGDPWQRPGRPHLDGFGRRHRLQGQARHRQRRALRRGREPCLHQLHEHRADQRHHLLLRRLGGDRRRGKPQLRAGERDAAGIRPQHRRASRRPLATPRSPSPGRLRPVRPATTSSAPPSAAGPTL